MTTNKLLCSFAWSIVACSASGWRMVGLGPGETWLGLTTLFAVWHIQPDRHQSTVSQIWLWLVGLSLSAMLTGTLWAAAIGVWAAAPFVHDGLALLFCFASLTVLVPFLTDSGQYTYFLRQFLRASLFLSLINGLAYILFQQYLGEATFWISRFNGLSANPNQLALYCCLTPFWLLQRPRVLPPQQTTVGLMACLSIGWLTGSEALLLAWGVGGLWLCWRAIQIRLKRTDVVRHAHAQTVLISLTTGLLLATAALIQESVANVYAIGGQGDLRLQRWQNGLLAWGQSPVFGLGPGAFSGDQHAFGGYEAHNLYIDWIASGGLLAGLALIWFQYRAWLNVRTKRADALMAGFCSLLVFSWFHYVVRHPIFWLHHLLFLSKPAPSNSPSPSCVASSAR